MNKDKLSINGVRLLLLSFLLGFINYLVTGGDKHTLTPTVIAAGISFTLGMALMGLGLFISKLKEGASRSKLAVYLGIFVCGLSFLVVFINGPVLRNDLNSGLSIFFGVLFMLGVVVTLISSILTNLNNKNELTDNNDGVENID